MKTFMLLMFIWNPAKGYEDTYVLDFNLSEADCEEALPNWEIDNPLVRLDCEEEVTR